MRRVIAAVAAVGLLTACGGSKPGTPAVGGSSSTSAGPATVVVKQFSFSPGNLTVSRGTKVTWQFEDTAAHNVTSTAKKFASPDIRSGSYSYVFTSPGTYGYYCSIHQYMTGSVTVR